MGTHFMQVTTFLKLVMGFLIVNAPHATALNYLGLLLDIFLYRLNTETPDLDGIFGALFLTTGTSALHHLFEHVDKVRCRNAALADNATSGEMRAHSLLSHLCEAVVVLDQDLRFAISSPKLAGLLLQMETDDALYGKLFTDLLVNDDRASFEELALQRSRSDESGRVKVRLRTSIGQSISCELHHVRFVQVDLAGNEEVSHVIGILSWEIIHSPTWGVWI